MKCSFCGTENVPGRTHCIACGTPLTNGSAPVVPMVAEPVETPVVPQQSAIVPEVSEPPMQINHVAIPEPEPVVEAPAQEMTITYPAPASDPITPTAAELPSTPVSESESFGSEPAPLPPLPENSPVYTESQPVAGQADYQSPESAPVVPAVSYLDNVDSKPTPHPGRVDVQFNDQEVAEMPMTIHNESPHGEPVMNSVSADSGAGEVGEDVSATRTGPWLALTVLVVIGLLIIGVIYFVYHLIFGGTQQGSVITQPLPVPTATISIAPSATPVVTPSITSSPAVSVSDNDAQREKDVADLRTAMANYFADNGKYPNAVSYNSLLNALISTHYLTRRIQDPLFPTQQYQYSVTADQSAYTITIQFEGLGSNLLSGSTTYQFGSN